MELYWIVCPLVEKITLVRNNYRITTVLIVNFVEIL